MNRAAQAGALAALQDDTWLSDVQGRIAEARDIGYVAFDTETTSLDAMQAELAGFSLATAPGKACFPQRVSSSMPPNRSIGERSCEIGFGGNHPPLTVSSQNDDLPSICTLQESLSLCDRAEDSCRTIDLNRAGLSHLTKYKNRFRCDLQQSWSDIQIVKVFRVS